MATAIVGIDDQGTKILADLRHTFGLSLYRYGFPDPEARLIQTLLRPGDVFLDGGAHIGVFTLLAAATVGKTGRVIACEPVPQTMRLLEANVALNRFLWVDTHTVALGERSGRSEFFSFGGGSALSSFAPANVTSSQRVVVDVTTLDNVVGSYRQRVRLIKLDVEGAELRALRGAQGLLASKADFLIELEPDHLARQQATVSELHSVFADAGYCGYVINQEREGMSLVPMDTWARPSGNPNILVSARPQHTLLGS